MFLEYYSLSGNISLTKEEEAEKQEDYTVKTQDNKCVG